MNLLIDILSWVLLAGGSFFVLTGSIGLVRMPDFFSRTHPAGLIDTVGASLIIGGLMMQSGFTQVTIKLVLILILLFLTSPTATHALAQAALADGLEPWRRKGGEATPDDDEPGEEDH